MPALTDRSEALAVGGALVIVAVYSIWWLEFRNGGVRGG